MTPALVMMCIVQGLACQSADAHRIAAAIDVATDDDRLRAQLTVAAWEESRFREHPVPDAWDSRAGIAKGPWQLWHGGEADLVTQARSWLWLAQRGGLAGMCGFGPKAARMAYRRATEAAKLLELVAKN